MKNWFWISIFSFLIPAKLMAAACCGGGGSSANLIIGDYSSQFAVSSSYSNVVGDQSGADKVRFWNDGREQKTLTYKLSAATLIGERFQTGASGEYLQKRYEFSSGNKENSNHLGDTSLFVSYEMWTESFYRSWWPRFFISLTHTLPTGIGLYESQKRGMSDVNGLGRHQTQLGLHFYKRLPSFLLRSKIEVYQRFKKDKVGSSNGGSFEIGIARLPPKSAWSYGIGVKTIINEGANVQEEQALVRTPQERFFEVNPHVSYSFDNNWGVDASYTDQTIIGPVKNTTLSRTFALTLNKYISL